MRQLLRSMGGVLVGSILGAVVLAAAAAQAGDVMPVRGSLQFWHRHCKAPHDCALPEAIGGRQPVDGEIKPPSSATSLGIWSGQFEGDGGLHLALEVFWRLANGDGPANAGFFATQATLSRSGPDGAALPLAQCSQYLALSDQSAFPVGACAGFVPQAEGFDEIGVTFYR